MAAQLAVRILGGESVASIAVVKESPNRFMFDFRELQRFGIDPTLLPADSVVINRPVTLYSQYKELVWGVVGGFFALTVIIALLLGNAATRRRANREISTAKDRFQKIFDNAAVVLFEVDFSRVYQKTASLMEKGVADLASHFTNHPDEMQEFVSLVRIADCNRAALTLYGAVTKDELLQSMRKALQVFSGADLQWILIALMNKEAHLEWETVCTRLDGEIIHLLMSLSPSYQTGEDRTLIVSAVDITERKRFLEALSLSENRFRTLFDSAASGIALVDLDGRYLRVNDAFCLMLGSGRKELENSNWQEVTHPGDIERSQEMIARILANQPVSPMEKRYLHSGGQIVWALTSVGLNTDRDGEPLNFVSQMQDITLMKKVQAEMQQSEARYRRIFEADLSGFYLASPSGKVLLCNQIFAGILGLTSAAEAVGQNISTFYRKTETWSRLVGELADGMKVENSEVELHRGDGETVTVLCNSIGRFDEHGTLVEVQGHMMDISRQKTLETQLVRAQKMEAIGLMAGGVAHDLNNILSGIINYPELMLATLDKDSHLRKPLESVRESGQRAATVVADLLTVARSAANVREPHNVLDLVREYLDSPECSRLCSLYPKIPIQLECRLADGIILCSPVHIKKCVMNLVTNAMEAIEDQGQVLIAIRGETVMDEDRGGKTVARDSVVIEVTDNGPGISEKDRERIFEPFYTKKIMGKSGTGLGLAVVWNTVQEHGGKIKVTSNERGTTFSLHLPRHARPGLAVVKEKDKAPPPGGGEHVLVVDDEPALRDIAEQILTLLGYRVDVVGSGEEAVAFVRRRKVDLVLLDMFMEPGMNGRLTYERLIEMYPGQKAIIVSGFSKSDDVKKALRLGVGSFIEKPYSTAQLGRAVYRELHGDA
jgi:PAS domain S-box-containing protein